MELPAKDKNIPIQPIAAPQPNLNVIVDVGDDSELETSEMSPIDRKHPSHIWVVSRPLSRKKTGKSRWQRAVDYFSYAAEVSNVGILIEILGRWFPAMMSLGAGFVSTITFWADPAIYFFRSLVRITRIIGREFFDVNFEEEKLGKHKQQTVADIVSLTLFTLSIFLFAGLITASPVGITVAWALAITGISIVTYFDCGHQVKLAKEKSEEVKDDTYIPGYFKEKLRKDYEEKNIHQKLMITLIVGLSIVLLCGSAAVFAPPLLVPILFLASKAASFILGGVACIRFYRWATSKKEVDVFEDRINHLPSPTSSSAEINRLTSRALSPLSENVKKDPSASIVSTSLEKSPSSRSGMFANYHYSSEDEEDIDFTARPQR